MRNPEVLEDADDYSNHVQLYKHQYQLYRHHIDNLQAKEVIVILDYTTVNETSAFIRSSKFQIFFFDFWNETSKDYSYTITAFDCLLSYYWFRNFNNFIVWADGGLRSKEIVYYLSWNLSW